MKSIERFKKGAHGLVEEPLTILLLLLGISLVFPLIAVNVTRFYRLPVGGDVGGFLKMSYAIFENNYPMWGDNPLQYPPLLFFIIYPTSKILGEIWAINAIGLLLLALRPLAIFIFIKKMFKSQYLALLGAAADAFFPSYYEMYAFGGYPNLLGFVILPVAFAYIFQASSSIRLKQFVGIFLLSLLAVVSHHLTSILFLMTMSLWLLYKLLKKEYRIFALMSLAVFLPAIFYRLLVGGASDFVFFNESAYVAFVIDSKDIIYVFKDTWLLAFLISLSLVGLYELFRVERGKAILLSSWLFSPLLFYVAVYSTRIMAIDNVRMLFFLVQPLILTTAYTLKVLWNKRSFALVLGLSSLILVSSLTFGFVTLNNAVIYNKATLEDKYSDVDSYNMVMWMKSNVQQDSVLVTRAPLISNYIIGIDHIRVMRGGISPKLLFKQGEQERNLASEAVISTNIFGYSDMFKIKDQTPVLFARTPYIYVFAGDDYRLLGYFADHYPWEIKKLTLNASEIFVGQDSYEIHYSASTPLNKTVTLQSDQVTVSYKTQKMNANLTNFFWLAWGKDWQLKNNTLITDYGNIQLTTNASASRIYDTTWNQCKIRFQSFGEQTITFKTENKRITHGNVVLTTRRDLIDQYHVTHILLRKDDDEALKWIENFQEWKLVHSNKLFSLYSLQQIDNAKAHVITEP